MGSEIIYPAWKAIAWRFVRAGIAGGIGSVAAVQIVLKPDLSNFKGFALLVIAAFSSGFISGAGLFLRDYFGDKDRSEGVVNKLPI